MDAASGAAKQGAGGASKLRAEAGAASPVASPAGPAASPLAAATPPSAAPPLAAPSATPGSGEGGAHLAAIECLLTASPHLALALMLAGGSEGGQGGEGGAAAAAAAGAGDGKPEAAAAPAPAAKKAPPRTKAALRAAAAQRAEKRGEKRQRLSNVTLSEPEAAGEEEEEEPTAAAAAAAGAGAGAADAAAAAAAAVGGQAEAEAEAPAEKKPRAKKAKKPLAPLGPRRYVCSDITMEILEREGCFDMTEWDATRHLGFGSATVLKKLVLPRLGMKVWPYRKRATMKGIREGLEAYLETHGHHADQEKVADLLTQVRAAEQHVRDNPKVCTELSREMTALRQRLYKLKNEEKAGVLNADKWAHQINMLVNNTLRDFAKAAAGGEGEAEGEAEGVAEEGEQ